MNLPGSKLCPRAEMKSVMFDCFMVIEELIGEGYGDFPSVQCIDDMPKEMLISAWQEVYRHWLRLPPHLQRAIRVPFPKGSAMAETLMAYQPRIDWTQDMITHEDLIQ